MRRSIMLLAAIVAAAAAPAMAQDVGALRASAPRQDFPGGVLRVNDVPFETVQGYRPVLADLYIPAGTAGPHPAVVFFHGGAWAGGNPRMGGYDEQAARLSARGYVVMSADYRFTGEARFPAQVQDAKAAVRWLRDHADLYGVDPARVAAWGESAGAYLAAMLGTSCGAADLEPPMPAPRRAPPGMAGAPPPPLPVKPAASDCVQAVATFYGIFDFRAAAAAAMAQGRRPNPEAPEAQLLGCDLATCPTALVERSRVAFYIDRSDPPFLLVHGTSDKLVPYSQSENLAAAIKAAGIAVEVMLVPGVDHIFIGATPAQRQAIEVKTFAFFDRTIGRPR